MRMRNTPTDDTVFQNLSPNEYTDGNARDTASANRYHVIVVPIKASSIFLIPDQPFLVIAKRTVRRIDARKKSSKSESQRNWVIRG